MIKKVTLSILIVFLFYSFNQTVLSSTTDFVDLSSKHWAYESVIDIVNKYKLIEGFPDRTFRGDKNVNHYELAIIVDKYLTQLEQKYNILLEDKNRGDGVVITDIPKNHWAYESVYSMVNGYHILTHKINGTKFEGDKLVTRYDLAYTLYSIINLLEQKKGNITLKEVDISRKLLDLDETHWANLSVKMVIDRYQIMSPFADFTFRGKKEITRYELVVSFLKMIKLIEKII